MIIDVSALKALLGPLGWFLSLGSSDTKHIRNELNDLLFHTTQSLRSLVELADVLEYIEQSAFNKNTFGPIYVHCRAYLTGPEASKKARTHCTDIERDINRISFKVTKYLRAEIGSWKGLNESFEMLSDADEAFLEEFEDELLRIDEELQAVFHKLYELDQPELAWKQYDSLRLSVLKGHQGLKKEMKKMNEAENHIRKILT